MGSPCSKYSPAVMTVARIIASVWLPIAYWYRCSGLENLPRSGPVILAPNHTSFLDPILITYPVRHRRIYYLAWHQLFSNPLFARLIRSLGAISLNTDKKADRAAFEAAIELLHAGEAVCLFPEGIRGWDGKVYALKPGVARIAVSTGAPIVPVVITGALRAWPRWKLLPRPFVPIQVKFLPPIEVAAAATGAERRRETTRVLERLDKALRSELEPPN